MISDEDATIPPPPAAAVPALTGKPDALARLERLRDRRRAVFGSAANGPATAGTATQPPDEPWGLALSGGGIRSATYSLGVVQALALAGRRIDRDPPPAADLPPPAQPAGTKFLGSLLSRFDYLSTVSGGGYLGAFVASLFVADRLRPRSAASPADPLAQAAFDADGAIEALCNEPPGRVRATSSSDPGAWATFPLAWLRENGRYLMPTGAGDAAYAAALGLRNWLAVQYVIGTLIATVFAILVALSDTPFTNRWLHALGTPDGAFAVDLSPLLALSALPFVLWALPVGLAFWLSYPAPIGTRAKPGPGSGGPHRRRRRLRLSATVLALLGISAVLGLAASQDPLRLRQEVWTAACVVTVLSVVWYGVACRRARGDGPDNLAARRVLLTRWLTTALQTTVAMLVLGLLDSAGRLLWGLSADSPNSFHIAWPAALAAVLSFVARRLAPLLADAGQGEGWVQRVPLTVLSGLAGGTIFACIAILWSYVVNWVVQQRGQSADERMVVAWTFVVALLGLAWLTGRFPGFINLSSLQSFYSARLARAYLGASNRERFEARHEAGTRRLSTAEPVRKDDLDVSAYWDGAQPTTFAPLHLINVTLNKTVDPAEQLVQRDRKGQPLLVTPLGFAIDGQVTRFGKVTDASEISRTLTVGQWVGTSGAAVSTGLGRQTSLGLSLLLGWANIRLGVWWQSGCGLEPKSHVAMKWLRRSFETQAYLLDEFRGRFYGIKRPWQYLSDGGHYENTGLYELLRPARGLRFVVAVDAATDPHYAFEDLANLIRLVRIDHKLELSVDPLTRERRLRSVFATTDEFHAAARDTTSERPARLSKCALLLRLRKPGDDQVLCWVVLLKPHLLADTSADVVQYAHANDSFPQESTADQFFDEAQWESYRKLGLGNAERLLAPDIRRALARYTGLKSIAADDACD